jgi:hypothetical protein
MRIRDAVLRQGEQRRVSIVRVAVPLRRQPTRRGADGST